MTVNPHVQFSLFSELKGAAAYNGLEQENRTNSMSEEANSYKTPSRFSSGLFKLHQNQSRTLPATPNAAAAQNDVPKIRLASHENQLTPGPRNPVARTRSSLPPVTAAEPKNRSGSAAMTTSGHATTNKGPGGGRSKAGT